MPSSTSTSLMSFSHHFYTLTLLSVLLVAFFPGAFHYLTTLPLAYIFPPTPPPPSSTAAAVTETPPSPSPIPTMSWFQKQFTLPTSSRGSYLVTDHVVGALPELGRYKVGLLHLFVQHTSCALSLNENWDEDVRTDMSNALDRIAPQGNNLYIHDAEGPDDMPAHIKSALIGASVTIPIKDGQLATGTWQGIWYLEFRKARHTRRVVATIQGELKS
ncbi:hypothetical protein F4778DRAFT_782501 [Xylariomycetidae sp. FL2044]|nr:hypothetical protein F4778DRAFT_782501 [Xylariomycetidae sp. FL2044]